MSTIFGVFWNYIVSMIQNVFYTINCMNLGKLESKGMNEQRKNIPETPQWTDLATTPFSISAKVVANILLRKTGVNVLLKKKSLSYEDEWWQAENFKSFILLTQSKYTVRDLVRILGNRKNRTLLSEAYAEKLQTTAQSEWMQPLITISPAGQDRKLVVADVAQLLWLDEEQFAKYYNVKCEKKRKKVAWWCKKSCVQEF